eukprot:403374152
MSVNQDNSEYIPNQQSPNLSSTMPKKLLNNINLLGVANQRRRDYAARKIQTNFDNEQLNMKRIDLLSPQIKPNFDSDLLDSKFNYRDELEETKNSQNLNKEKGFHRLQTSQVYPKKQNNYHQENNYGLFTKEVISNFNQSENGKNEVASDIDIQHKIQQKIQKQPTNDNNSIKLNRIGSTSKQHLYAGSIDYGERTPDNNAISPVQIGRKKFHLGQNNNINESALKQQQNGDTVSIVRLSNSDQKNRTPTIVFTKENTVSIKQSQEGNFHNQLQPSIPEKLINDTRDLILFGQTNNKINVNKSNSNNNRRQSRRGSFLRLINNPNMGSNIQELASRLQSKIQTTNNDQTNENFLPSIHSQQKGGPETISNINTLQATDFNADHTKVTFFAEDPMRSQQRVEKFQIPYMPTVSKFGGGGGFGYNQNLDLWQATHQKLDDKVNWQIMNLDLEDMNRNTRFFKDYLKDQIKEQKQKKSKKKLNDDSTNLFKKQDSLTKGIQAESSAPLRRLTNRRLNEGAESKKQNKKNEELLNRKKRNSIKTLFGRPSQKQSQMSVVDENMSINSSYNFTSSNDSADSVTGKKIKRKRSMIQSAFNFFYSSKDDKDDDEINEIQIRRINQGRSKQSFVLYPDSSLRSFIDGVSFLLMLVISVYIPFIISFTVDTSGPFDYFELFIDIWFMLEIFCNFFTGFYLKGLLIMNRKQIFITYIKNWFAIDICSSAPILIISIVSQDQTNNYQAVRSTKLIRILRFARYARLIRLMKFLRLNKYLQPFEELIVSDWAHLFVRFLKISCAVIFITHWAGCVIYSVGVNEFDMLGENWLSLQNLNDASIFEQYINSLYWASATMCTVGYGDFHPTTSNERIIAMIVMIMSSGVFAFIIGDIGRMVSGFNILADQFKEKMIYVDRFLTQKDIPVNLRLQVKRYLEYNLQLKKLYKIEEYDLLSLLNKNLRGKITVYFNGRILQNIDVLSKFPIEFLSNLSIILRKQTYSIDENLIIEKTESGELFYMQTGRVSAIHMKTKTHLVDLEKEKYFGEISFFTELPRQATIKARDFTEVLILTREDFLSMALKVENLNVLSLYHKIRESVIESPKDFRQLKIRCYICYTQGHIAIDCKQFHRFKGNLKRYFKKLYKQSINSESQSEDEKKKNPITNTLESRKSVKDKKRPRRKSKSSKRRFSYKKFTPQRTPSESLIDDYTRFEFPNNSSNLRDISNSCERDTDFVDKHRNSPNFYDEMFDDQNNQSQNLSSLNQTPFFGLQFNATLKQNSAKNLGDFVNNRDRSLTPKASLFDSDSHSIGDNNFQLVHFDTPPKLEDNESSNFIQNVNQNKRATYKKRKSKGIRDVIQEELLEEDEDSSNLSQSSSDSETSSSENSSQTTSSKSSSSALETVINDDTKLHDFEEEEKIPLLSQTTSQQRAGQPKSMNQLTRLISEKK